MAWVKISEAPATASPKTISLREYEKKLTPAPEVKTEAPSYSSMILPTPEEYAKSAGSEQRKAAHKEERKLAELKKLPEPVKYREHKSAQPSTLGTGSGDAEIDAYLAGVNYKADQAFDYGAKGQIGQAIAGGTQQAAGSISNAVAAATARGANVKRNEGAPTLGGSSGDAELDAYLAKTTENAQMATTVTKEREKQLAEISKAAEQQADKLSEKAQKNLETAKGNSTALGKVGVDIGSQAVQMAIDLAAGTVTGTGAMAPMAIRSFGMGAQEARQKGYSELDQFRLGVTSAMTEYITEKLFGGNPVYDDDAGLVNKFVNSAVNRVSKNKAFNETLMKVLASTPFDVLNEGLEEIVSDIVNPLAELAITGNYDAPTWDEVIYDGAIGAAMSILGLSGQAMINNGRAARQAGTTGGETGNISLPTPEAYAQQQAAARGGTVDAATETPVQAQKTASTGETVLKETPKGKALLEETTEQRAQRLAADEVTITKAKADSGKPFDLAKLKNLKAGEANKYLRPILQTLGITGRSYHNAELEVTFAYSNENAKKSISHQSKETGKDFSGFSLVQNNLEQLCENAYPLEMHYDEKPKTTDNHVTGVASLASALDTGDGVIPVRMTVKFYDDKAPKLHIVINGATSITAGRTQNAPVSAGSNSATMRIADFLDIVKDSEEFTKRIPMDQITGTATSGETAIAQEGQKTSEYAALQMPTPEMYAKQKNGTISEGNVQKTEANEQKAPETGTKPGAADLRLPTPEEYAKQKNGTKPTAAETAAERQAALDEVFAGETLAEETVRREAEEAEYRKQQESDYREAERGGKQAEREGIAKTPKSRTQLKTEIQKIFSIPEGKKGDVNRTVDDMADAYMKTGSIPERYIDQLFDAFYSRGGYEQRADQYFEEFRRTTKGTKIYVNEAVRAEFGDDWNAFRKEAWAEGIRLTDNPADGGIDVHAAELAEMFPQLDTTQDLKGQIESIVDTARQGKPQQLTQTEMEDVIRGEWGSEAVQQRVDEMARKFRQAIDVFEASATTEAEVRDQAEKQIAKMRAKTQEIAKKQVEKRAMAELQNKTLKQLQWLSKNRNKAPEDLRTQFDAVLGNIDTIAVNAANEMHVDNATGKTWKDLRDLYLKAKETDPNFLPSKELEKIVMRLDGDKIGDMDVSALNDLYRAAAGLRTEFYNRNNVINDELGRTFSEAYHASIDEVKAAKGTTKKKAADLFFNEQQLTPMNVLRRMTGWKDGTFNSFAKGLEKGERDYKGYVVDAKKKLGDFLDKNKDWVKTADGQGKDAVWYEIEVPELAELGMGDKPIFGDTVTVYMTPAQKVYMALEAQNYDNLRHMTGGRTFVNKELYAHGDRAAAFANGTTVKLAPETVKKIVSDLTPTEKELYKVLHEYFNVYAKERINGVSNPLYGFDRALTSEYAPIYTNQNYVGHEAGVMDATAEGVGALKSRQYSKNPTYNVSAFDAFDRHVDAAARFVGYAIPIRNMQTLMNWRGKNTSMRDEISHKWLDSGTKYIDDLMTDLQQTKINDKGFIDNEVGKLLSNYVSGVFGANPGIVFKQFMSYPQFASQMGWDTMPNPKKFAKVDTALIDKYTPELAYRLLGYATPEAAAMRQNKNGVTETKVGGFILGGGAITAMDGFTVARAWPWAENYVSKHFPNLEKGTQAEIEAGKSPYYQKVAEVFNDAVNTTQPMYDTMHRAKIMQSGGGIQRAFTMFKTVPLQQYNTLRRAFGELQEAKTGGTQEQKKAAAKTAANAVTATLASAAGLELVELLNQLWKNGAKGYKDDDDELTAESVTKQVGLRMFGDLAGITVGGSELAELLENIFLGEKWYGIEIPGGEQLNDVIDTLSGTINSISKIITDGIDLADKGGDLGAYLKKNAPDYAGDIKDLAEKTALYVGGLPAENIEKYLKGTIRAAAPEVYTYLEDRFDTADKTGLKGLTGTQLQIRTADILKNRGLDPETAETIAGLYEQGFKGAVPSAAPSSVTVNGEDHALSAAEQQRYEATWRAVVNRSLTELTEHERFESAEPAQQEKMLKKLYDYAADHGKYALFPETESEGMRTIDHSDGIADWIVWNTLSGGNVDSYQKLSEAGLSDDGFLQYKEAMKELGSDATKWQKARAVDSSNLSDEDLKAALQDLLTENQMNGWKIADKNGISSEYIDAMEFASGAEGVKDQEGNTITGSKALEIMMEIDSYDLTNTEKGVLYQALGYDGENKWRSKYKGPDFEAYYYLNDSEREKYWDYCSGMTATKFTEYITKMSTFHSTKVNGKTTESKQEKIIAYIDGLKLPVEQKDGLFKAEYKDGDLNKCPWHSRYQSLLLPKP